MNGSKPTKHPSRIPALAHDVNHVRSELLATGPALRPIACVKMCPVTALDARASTCPS